MTTPGPSASPPPPTPASLPSSETTTPPPKSKKKRETGNYEKIKNRRGRLVSKARSEAAKKRPLHPAFAANVARSKKVAASVKKKRASKKAA